MNDLIREAPIGQMIRFATRNKVLQYPEEKPDFQIPKCYNSTHVKEVEHSSPEPAVAAASEKEIEAAVKTPDSQDLNGLERAVTENVDLERATTRVDLGKVTTRAELEQTYTLATIDKGPSRPIVANKLDDGTVLVTWYDTHDPANPQNWSSRKKALVTCLICFYTLAVYMGSAIYTPSQEGVVHVFHVSIIASSLGLALYVLGYGIGPLIFSPLSEIPAIGRNPPYMITFGIFVILCVPTALVNNFAGLLVLRFLQGFFGSPCLATGGASLQDLYNIINLSYAIALWALFATCGPALGPIISGFSVPVMGWRWSLWELLWLSAPAFILLFLFLPETSSPNILLRRARRLRKLTGNQNLKSQSEIDQANITVRETVIESLWRPVQIMVQDPAISFSDVYTALLYAIFYSFFECFPLVYPVMYGFNVGQVGLTFLCITVSVLIALACYLSYLYFHVNPTIRTKGLPPPESRLIPALIGSFLLPIGLFIFGWTANPSIHWIVSVIGVTIYSGGVFIILQCLFVYIPLTYPQYAASLLAGNDFLRSALAAGAIMFARPLFVNLGVGPGVSLLAGLTAGCILGIFGLWYFGAALRARSKFAAK